VRLQELRNGSLRRLLYFDNFASLLPYENSRIPAKPMSSPTRLILILQLFERDRPVWTVEQITRALGLSASTVYRHVRNLVSGGFLDPVTGAGYALGPAFIRYDRILRQSDPLIQCATPVMSALLERTNQSCTVVLCRRFKDCVMCVHEVRGSKFRGKAGYERGVAMPIFLGATSKVILAQLPVRMLKGIYLANEKTIRRVSRSHDWSGFEAEIKGIRNAGYALTKSEVARGRVGLAAPIARNGQAFASISLVGDRKDWNQKKIENFVAHVRDAAAQISRALSRETAIISR
jgi:DNA-binding IclR family transcriptional regulator